MYYITEKSEEGSFYGPFLSEKTAIEFVKERAKEDRKEYLIVRAIKSVSLEIGFKIKELK